jgi:N-acetylglucosamine kinase-like BadF-type ATPase
VTRAAVLAVDGGGSKTDIALIARGGRVLSAIRVGGASFSPDRQLASMATLKHGVETAARAAGIAPHDGAVAEIGAFCLAGADLPVDDRRILPAIRAAGMANHVLLRNDTFAVLRAGTDLGWGVGVVCGTGLNCAGVAPDGRTVRFPALGAISGDGFGGGGDLAVEAVGATVRARDGRGPRTELERLIPAHFGARHPYQVLERIHVGKIEFRQVIALAPVVLRAADGGDAVAAQLVTRLADELVVMVRAAVHRLRITQLDLDVVLGGGIVRSDCEVFHARVRAGITDAAPNARVVIMDAPPVVGAALLGLDQIDGRSAKTARAATRRVRKMLTGESLT